MVETPCLKLAGTDAEDLAILSAVLQDAIVLPSEIRFDKNAHQFQFVAQRYRYEDAGATTRINCRISTTPMLGVSATADLPNSSIRPNAQPVADQALSLLAIRLLPDTDIVQFDFSGGGAIRVTLGPGWQLRLEDFGTPWPAACPAHRAG